MINAQPQYFFDHSGRELISLPVKGTDDRVVTEAALWRNACPTLRPFRSALLD